MTIGRHVRAIRACTDVPSISQPEFTDQARHEIKHLTSTIFFKNAALDRQSVLMLDIGGRTSSLWIALGVASVLGKRLNQTVHVLAVGDDSSDSDSATSRSQPESSLGGYVFQRFKDADSPQNLANELTDRISALRAGGCVVIAHLSHSEERAGIAQRLDFVDGIVLLIRASQTRRSAIETIEQQLVTASVPLIGAVLLDRVNPIPEKLYRLL